MLARARIGYPYAVSDPCEEREAVVILQPHHYPGFSCVYKNEQKCQLVASDPGPQILNHIVRKGVCGYLIEPDDKRESIAVNGRITGQGTSMQLALVLAVFAKYDREWSSLPLILCSAAIESPAGARDFIDATIETYCRDEEVLIGLIRKYSAAKMAKAAALVLPDRDAKILCNEIGKHCYSLSELTHILLEKHSCNCPKIIGVKQQQLPQLAKNLGIRCSHYQQQTFKKWLLAIPILLCSLFLCINFFSQRVLYNDIELNFTFNYDVAPAISSYKMVKISLTDLTTRHMYKIDRNPYLIPPGKYLLQATAHTPGYKTIEKNITVRNAFPNHIEELHFITSIDNDKTHLVVARVLDELNYEIISPIVIHKKASQQLLKIVQKWVKKVGHKCVYPQTITKMLRHIDWRTRLVAFYIMVQVRSAYPEIQNMFWEYVKKNPGETFVTVDIKQKFLQNLHEQHLIFANGDVKTQVAILQNLCKSPTTQISAYIPHIKNAINNDNAALFSHENLPTAVRFFYIYGNELGELSREILQLKNGYVITRIIPFLGDAVVSHIIKRIPHCSQKEYETLKSYLEVIHIQDAQYIKNIVMYFADDEDTALKIITNMRNHSQAASELCKYIHNENYHPFVEKLIVQLILKRGWHRHFVKLREYFIKKLYEKPEPYFQVLIALNATTDASVIVQNISQNDRHLLPEIVKKIDPKGQCIPTLIKLLSRNEVYAAKTLVTLGNIAAPPVIAYLQSNPKNALAWEVVAHLDKNIIGEISLPVIRDQQVFFFTAIAKLAMDDIKAKTYLLDVLRQAHTSVTTKKIILQYMVKNNCGEGIIYGLREKQLQTFVLENIIGYRLHCGDEVVHELQTIIANVSYELKGRIAIALSFTKTSFTTSVDIIRSQLQDELSFLNTKYLHYLNELSGDILANKQLATAIFPVLLDSIHKYWRIHRAIDLRKIRGLLRYGDVSEWIKVMKLFPSDESCFIAVEKMITDKHQQQLMTAVERKNILVHKLKYDSLEIKVLKLLAKAAPKNKKLREILAEMLLYDYEDLRIYSVVYYLQKYGL